MASNPALILADGVGLPSLRSGGLRFAPARTSFDPWLRIPPSPWRMGWDCPRFAQAVCASLRLEPPLIRGFESRPHPGGWGGIRTHGAREGTHAFQACPIDHSGTHPTPRISELLFMPPPGTSRKSFRTCRLQPIPPVTLSKRPGQIDASCDFMRVNPSHFDALLNILPRLSITHKSL